MDQDVHIITVAVDDLDAARRFYVSGLGWRPLFEEPGEIQFYQSAPGQVLGLFDAEALDADIGDGGVHSRPGGFTLAQNLHDADLVHRTVDRMERAGATILKQPQPAAVPGMMHAYVRDPVGIVWEIAHNPGWRVDDDGAVVFDAPDAG